MKATGIVRNLDSLGRVVIPMELRRTLDIKDGDALEIFVDGERIILGKFAPGCGLCGSVERNLVSFHQNKLLCKSCIQLIVKNEVKLLESFGTN